MNISTLKVAINEARRFLFTQGRAAGIMKNKFSGIITPGSVIGRRFGFTADLFDGWLWLEDDRVMISMIISRKPGQGHLSRLLDAIGSQGYRVGVPTPFAHMAAILERKGYVPHTEDAGEMGPVEVWEKPCSHGSPAVKERDNT